MSVGAELESELGFRLARAGLLYPFWCLQLAKSRVWRLL